MAKPDGPPHEALAKCGRGEFLLDIQQEKSIKTRGNKNSVFMIFLIVYSRFRAAHLSPTKFFKFCGARCSHAILVGRQEKLKMPHHGGIFDFWQPYSDLNRDSRLERAVS